MRSGFPGKLVRVQLTALPGEQRAGVQLGALGEPEMTPPSKRAAMNRPHSGNRRRLASSFHVPLLLVVSELSATPGIRGLCCVREGLVLGQRFLDKPRDPSAWQSSISPSLLH